MAVTSKDGENKLNLEIDNGDYKEFMNAMKKWDFKDHQSLMRFAISLLVLNENKFFPIKVKNEERYIVPAADLLVKGSDNER